jgi:naphthalene 1,2-dioxygenase ferredoxin reductase component
MRARSRPIACRVVGLEAPTADIRLVRLQTIQDEAFQFAAGQYARVTFGEHGGRHYSMASIPGHPELEFHVRHVEGGGASAHVARQLRIGDHVWVEGPYGDAYLRHAHPGPVLAIAGGTGLAPVKSIVETALALGLSQEITLYYGAKNERGLYLQAHFRKLAARHRNFRFVPIFETAADGSIGRTVVEALAADLDSAVGMKAYVAGPPAMVAVAARVLTQRGLCDADLHADPFPIKRVTAPADAFAAVAAASAPAAISGS